MSLRNVQNKEWMKTQEDYHAVESHGKERLEGYSTSFA